MKIENFVFFYYFGKLGAWWLGWIILGFLMFIFAGLIGLFPKHLPKKKKKAVAYDIDGEKCDQTTEIPGKHDDTDATLKSKSIINENE